MCLQFLSLLCHIFMFGICTVTKIDLSRILGCKVIYCIYESFLTSC